ASRAGDLPVFEAVFDLSTSSTQGHRIFSCPGEPPGAQRHHPALGAWRLRVLLCWEYGDAVHGVSGHWLHGGSTDSYDCLRNADVHGAGRQDARGYPAV